MPDTPKVATDRDRWVDKVRKLLAKAESTSPAEAEALLAKVGELMARWQIEEAELREAGGTDWVDGHVIPLGTYSPTADAQAIVSVVKPLGVHVAYTAYAGAGTRPRVFLYGWRPDVDRAEVLWTLVQAQLVREMKAAEAKTRFRSRGDLRRWRMSFKIGYARRVGVRLLEARTRVRAEPASTGAALVLVDREAEALERFREATDRRTHRGALHLDRGGLVAGDAAGARADLGQDRLAGDKSKELNP